MKWAGVHGAVPRRVTSYSPGRCGQYDESTVNMPICRVASPHGLVEGAKGEA